MAGRQTLADLMAEIILNTVLVLWGYLQYLRHRKISFFPIVSVDRVLYELASTNWIKVDRTSFKKSISGP